MISVLFEGEFMEGNIPLERPIRIAEGVRVCRRDHLESPRAFHQSQVRKGDNTRDCDDEVKVVVTIMLVIMIMMMTTSMMRIRWENGNVV